MLTAVSGYYDGNGIVMDENFIGKKQEIKLLQAIKEGLFHNEYSVSVQYQVTLDDLFVD